jgi:hypothetical protein
VKRNSQKDHRMYDGDQGTLAIRKYREVVHKLMLASPFLCDSCRDAWHRTL